MSRTFEIEREPYEYGEFVYTKDEFTFEPGVTVLAGCNGIGKTTLLKTIEKELERKEIPHISYNNYKDGGDTSLSKALFYGAMDLAGALFCTSEGEQIVTNMADQAGRIGGFVKDNASAGEIWILFDAIDSGLSVDNIVEIKELLFKKILEYNADREVYIIVSANEYEMCRQERCFDTRNGEYLEFKTYDSYRRFILKSRKQKDNRRKKRGSMNGGTNGKSRNQKR